MLDVSRVRIKNLYNTVRSPGCTCWANPITTSGIKLCRVPKKLN